MQKISTHPNPIISEDIDSISSGKLANRIKVNSRFLVTGASGFITAYIVEALLRLNEKYKKNLYVYALARNEEKFWKRYQHHKGNKSLVFVKGDVTDASVCNSVEEVTHIIHAASYASPKYYGVDPVGTYSANTIGTNNLLEIAYKYKVEKFLFVSSAEVYGNAKDNPISENEFGCINPMQVRSCYAESKRMGENMCVAWYHQYSVPIVIVRPFHTYGPGMSLDDGRVYADFVKDIVASQSIKLNSDGSAERAFCYLADAVKGIFDVLFLGELCEAYNLGNPEEILSIKRLAQLLQSLYPERCPSVSFFSDSKSDGYIASTVNKIFPNIEKLKLLGWMPVTSVDKGFKRTIESYLNETH